MTAQEYFRNKGRGSQKLTALKMGFSVQHFRSVISGQIAASPFFVTCLKECLPDISILGLRVTNGRRSCELRAYSNNGAYEIWLGKKYICRVKTIDAVQSYIASNK